MAKSKNGILDGFTGKIGTVVGYNHMGNYYMRSLPTPSGKKPSARQLECRKKFAALSRLATAMSDVAQLGFCFMACKSPLSPRNIFISVNQSNVFISEENIVVDYEHLIVSDGTLANVEWGDFSIDGDGVLTAEYEDILAGVWKNSDYVYLVAYDSDEGRAYLSLPMLRPYEKITLSLPTDILSHRIYLYGFTCNRKGNASKSTYIGRL